MPLFSGISIRRIKLKIHFFITFIGVNITFYPQHYLGLKGMPRRYVDFPDTIINLNLLSSLGACVRVIGVIFFVIIIYESLISKQILMWINVLISND